MTPKNSNHQDVLLVSVETERGNSRKIFHKGQEVGFISYLPFHLLTTAILEDLEEDEMETMFPLFYRIKFDRGYYLKEIEIKEEFRSLGIGEHVIRKMQSELDAPILLYSLAAAEEFWEKVGFQHTESYYYLWEPSNVEPV